MNSGEEWMNIVRSVAKKKNKELETIIKIKYMLKVIHSILDDIEEWINTLENRIVDITQTKKKKKKKKRILKPLGQYQVYCLLSQKTKKQKSHRIYLKKQYLKTSLTLVKKLDIWVQEIYKVPQK